MATSIDGHLLKTVSTPLNRLITEGYVPDGNNEWNLVNVGFLQLVLTALQAGVDLDFAEVFDTMGVKLVRQNVALTGLNALPDLPTYTLKNKERLLLIAQTNATQNGFYEWQTGGALIRLYDWRDVIAGNGIAIAANNIAVRLLANSLAVNRDDNFLQFDSQGRLYARIAANATGLKLNANRELYIDGAELGGAGGGASLLDVPHPDIHGASGDDVLIPSDNAVFQIVGGNFRRDATVLCEGFTILEFFDRRSNLITMNVEATNLIGIHDVLVKHLTLDSENSGKHKFTVLGAAVIDTVSPNAKRGFTTQLTVTGEGFALLSQFAANNAGITISLLSVTDRFLVVIEVTVANSVLSGAYNLLCTNQMAGNVFTSGTSGNGKLIIFGSPFITNALGINTWNGFVEFPLGAIGAELRVNGTDLTDTISLLDANTGLTNGFTVNSVAGSGTQKVVNFDTSTDKNLIGLRNVFCEDLGTGENSGSSGNGKIALNFPFSNPRRAASWRAYGGAMLADWQFVGNTIEKTGGSGVCYLEMADIFLNPSYLTNQFGLHAADFITFFVANLFSNVVGDIYFILADRGTNVDIADFNTFPLAVKFSFDAANNCLIDYRSGNTNGGLQLSYDYRFRLQSATGASVTDTFFELGLGGAMPNSYRTFSAGSHQPKTVHIAMTDNFKLNDLYLMGRVGD
jgi:hypothetical protein